MALSWTVKGEPGAGNSDLYREVPLEDGEIREPRYELKPIYMAIVFRALAVGMRGITEENAAEFYSRVHLLEQVYGPAIQRVENAEVVPVYITAKDVQRMIGLDTNITPKTEAQFLRDAFGSKNGMLGDYRRVYGRETAPPSGRELAGVTTSGKPYYRSAGTGGRA